MGAGQELSREPARLDRNITEHTSGIATYIEMITMGVAQTTSCDTFSMSQPATYCDTFRRNCSWLLRQEMLSVRAKECVGAGTPAT